MTTLVTGERRWQWCPEPGLCLRGFWQDRGGVNTGIYLHGFRSDSSGNKSLAFARHAAQQQRSWLRFDWRGHGSSAGTFTDFRLSRLLADLEAIIAQLQGNLYLVGSSMGAWLAVLAAQRYPARIQGLLLLAPGFNFIQNHFMQLSDKDRARWCEAGLYTFKSYYDPSSYSLDYAALADAARFDVITEPVTLNCAVTVIHGEHDEVVPLATPSTFFNRLRASTKRFIVVPQGDHRLSGTEPLLNAELDRLWQVR